ncbi:MAG TPA: prepilin-type N-terminal cleavage/methylation domain-containing protein [Gemmatimonadales bacterium]
MRSTRRGFTLVELLVVVVILGILAAFAIGAVLQSRSRSFGAALHSDLRNLAAAQEGHLAEKGTYATDLTQLPVHASPGVTLVVTSGDSVGWGATATHPAAMQPTCAIFHGRPASVPAPAVAEGVIACQ